MANVNLSVSPREGSGKGVARKLRAAGRVPAILYGFGTEPQSVSIDGIDLRSALSTAAGVRVILRLRVDGGDKPYAALFKAVQRHPLSRKITHVDLMSIDLHLPVDVRVPINAVGIPVGVRTQGGNLEWQRRELEIRVLPTEIPEHIDVDVTGLELNDALHVGDIKVPGVELIDDAKLTICSVKTTRMSVAEAGSTEGEAEGGVAAGSGEGESGNGDADS